MSKLHLLTYTSGMKPLIRIFDKSVNGWVRKIPRSFDSFFLIITNIGDPVVVLGIAVLVGGAGLWQQDVAVALSAFVVPLTLVAGYGIKLLFERARPVGDFSHILKLDTFSFPSGHSSGSAAAYSLLGYISWHLLAAPYGYVLLAVLVAVPVLVGISRVYLSVHYPSDVVAGWILGAGMVIATVYVIRPLG